MWWEDSWGLLAHVAILGLSRTATVPSRVGRSLLSPHCNLHSQTTLPPDTSIKLIHHIWSWRKQRHTPLVLMGIWDGPSSTAKFVTKSLVLGALSEKTMLSPTNLHLLDFSGTRNTASNLDGLQAFLHTCMAWDFESRTGLGLEREPPLGQIQTVSA